jgi:hypothetical protein
MGRPITQAGPWRLLLWLLIFAVRPGRKPFSGTENPPIAFICELTKQVSVGIVLRDEGQPAISDRAGVAPDVSNPNATEQRFGSGTPALARLPRVMARPPVHSRRTLPRRVQIALEPTAEGLGMHRIFVGGKGRKHVQTAHSNVSKSTPARADSMLISIIWALHLGQAGRSNGADGTADDRRRDWVMVLPSQTGGSTTLSITGIALGADR